MINKKNFIKTVNSKITKIIIFLFLGLILLFPQSLLAVDWGKLGTSVSETIRGSAKDHPIKIDMGMVYMRDPNPIVSDSSEMATTNFYPRFTIYNFENNTWPETIQAGQDVVYKRIHGVAVFSLQNLYGINTFIEKAKTVSPETIAKIKDYYIYGVAQGVKYDEAKPIEDKYIIIPTNYYEYVRAKTEAEAIITTMKVLTAITGELSTIKYDGYFYPGLNFDDQYNKPEHLAEVRDFINKQSANPNDGYWVDDGWVNIRPETINEMRGNLEAKNNDYIFITKDKIKTLNSTLAQQYATGSCFEIKPVGQRNLCTTTITKNCKVNYTRSPGSDTTSQVMFTPGLTCEHLVSLFAYTNSMSIDTDSTTYQEKIAGAALKEATLFEPQVPFAGIKSGITLTDYINEIYKYLMEFALFLSGAMLVFGGAKYMLGHKDSIAMMRNAFIGVLLLSTTYIILKTINPQMTNLSNIEISTLNRVTLSVPTGQTAATGLVNETPKGTLAESDKVPYKDPYDFQIAAPTAQELQQYSNTKIWNTHYYTRYFNGSTSKTSDFPYPLIGSATGSPVLLWTNLSGWCDAAMEGSALFRVDGKVMTINFSKTACTASVDSIRTALGKEVSNIDEALEKINICGKTPAAKADGGATPKCSWWYSHPHSLYSSFTKLPSTSYFGGASTGGALIPLRSVAINRQSYKSVLLNYANLGINGQSPLKTNLVVYIPDARGAKMISPNGSEITHDGYFWISDSGGLIGKDTQFKMDIDGTTRINVGAKDQIDMFTGPLAQKFMDGEKMHKVYIIPQSAKPELYETFLNLQKKGFSW